MKSQSVMISAYIATVVLILALTITFVTIYPKSTSASFQYRQFDIIRFVKRKTYWEACELADAISGEYGADYIYVNITVYDLVDGRVVSVMQCRREPLGVPEEKLIMYNYHFSRLLGNGTMFIYDIEVGYR